MKVWRIFNLAIGYKPGELTFEFRGRKRVKELTFTYENTVYAWKDRTVKLNITFLSW